VIESFGQFLWEALRGRYRGICDSGGYQLHGYHKGAGRIAEVGARSYTGCDARQTNGDRCRLEMRLIVKMLR